MITLNAIAIVQDKNIDKFIIIHRSPIKPDIVPMRKPINGKLHAALVRFGGLFEKNFQLTGILVKNIRLAKKSNRTLFLNKVFMKLFVLRLLRCQK